VFSALAAPWQPATTWVEQSNVETKQWLAAEGRYALKWFARTVQLFNDRKNERGCSMPIRRIS
jgi:hypothetical protein